MKILCLFLLVVALPVFGQSLPIIQCDNATTNTVGFVTARGSFCYVPPRTVQVLPNPQPTNSLWATFYVVDSVSGAYVVGFTSIFSYGYPSNSIVFNVLQTSSGYSESAMPLTSANPSYVQAVGSVNGQFYDTNDYTESWSEGFGVGLVLLGFGWIMRIMRSGFHVE
jgi:hypothetical protein